MRRRCFWFFSPTPNSTTHSFSTSLLFPPSCASPALSIPRSCLFTVAEVLQALATSVKAMVKKSFSEARAFEHYGRPHSPAWKKRLCALSHRSQQFVSLKSQGDMAVRDVKRPISPASCVHVPPCRYDMSGTRRDCERRGGGGY